MIIAKEHMPLLENKDDKILLSEEKHSGEEFKKDFVQRLDAVLKQRGYLGGQHDRTKIEFAKKIGVNERQLHRNLSLEFFSKICVELQIDPVELLGLVWKSNKDIRNHIITCWKVENNIQLGGLRLYWKCDICGVENLEYLDPEFKLLDKITKLTDLNYDQGDYDKTELEVLRNLIRSISFECEDCGEFYLKLKGM